MSAVTVSTTLTQLVIAPTSGPSVTVTAPGQTVVSVATVGLQGPPGLGANDALAIANRLSEFDTPSAKAAARANIDLETIDLGTFN